MRYSLIISYKKGVEPGHIINAWKSVDAIFDTYRLKEREAKKINTGKTNIHIFKDVSKYRWIILDETHPLFNVPVLLNTKISSSAKYAIGLIIDSIAY